jgi:hypothetical protein
VEVCLRWIPQDLGRCLSSLDLRGSGLILYVHVSISDDCCSGALVLWGLSTKTSRLSSITRFVRLR